MPRGRRRALGEGSVYQRSQDGKWIADVYAGPHPKAGRPMRRKRTAATEKDALALLRKLHDEVKAGGHGQAPIRDTTLATYITDRWLPGLEARVRRGELRPQTADGYAQRATTWIVPTIGRTRLEKIKPGDVHALLDAVTNAGRSRTTANRVKAVLGYVLTAAPEASATSRG